MTDEVDAGKRLEHLRAVCAVLNEVATRTGLPASAVGEAVDNENVMMFELVEMILELRGEIDLDELVYRWHSGAWPGTSLEDVVRVLMGWDHAMFANWVTSGRSTDSTLSALGYELQWRPTVVPRGA